MYTENGFRVYGQEQVIAGTLEIGDYFISKRKFNEMSVFAVATGDVLISLVGTIGHILIIPSVFHPGIINPRLLRFRPKPEVCTPVFLRSLLLSESIRMQLDALATGGTMPVLSAEVIRKLSVIIVCRDEQERITEKIRHFELSISSSLSTLNKLRRLKTALMQDLLTGKVRVTPLLTESLQKANP